MDRRSFLIGLSAAAAAGPSLAKEALREVIVGEVSRDGFEIYITGAGGFHVGDVLTFSGVRRINPITKEPVNESAMFVITAAVPNGVNVIPIYPAMIPAPKQYATVDRLPRRGVAPIVVHPA